MKFDISRVLSSKKTTILLFAIYIIIMASATVIEKYYGTLVAKSIIYYSPLFILLQLFMVVNFIFMTVSMHFFSYKNITYLFIHISFILILSGAMITHIFSKEGVMHLREGEKSSQILLRNGVENVAYNLPFEIELKDFVLARYPGSQSPSSYESYLKIYLKDQEIDKKVYMNNVLDLNGYRFYQASYDKDEHGTILCVNYDVAGRIVTYVGYAILFVGLLLTLFDPRSRFRRLWREMNSRFCLLIFFLLLAPYILAADVDYNISRTHAEKFGQLPMQTDYGRIVPVSTFASEIVRKFKIEKLIGKLTPEQFLLSVIAFPMDWSLIPLIEIKDQDIAKLLECDNGYISYRNVFNEKGEYLLSDCIESIYIKSPSERTITDKKIMKIDDRLNIFHGLITHRMIRIFPKHTENGDNNWMPFEEIKNIKEYSEEKKLFIIYIQSIRTAVRTENWKLADNALDLIVTNQKRYADNSLIDINKIKAEALYNRYNLIRVSQIGYLVIGVLMMFAYFIFSDKFITSRRIIWNVLISVVIILFLIHTFSLTIRWYISDHAPWSNSYETMVFLSWSGVFCGFIFVRKNKLVSALATIFGGIILFVSGLNWMDPQITPLVPVLKSPWLMSHVASLVMAYGFLGISFMIGTVCLILSISKKENIIRLISDMTIINELSMQLGVAFLTVGIFLGAIWANESWGRYWSWDPKETWALITMVSYTANLHFRWFSRKNTDMIFNFLSQISFLVILMTFLGVNYFLSGMHSYGSNDSLSGMPVWVYLLFIIVFVVPGIVAYTSRICKRND